MTTIEEILGKCVIRVQFDRSKIEKLPVPCYGCDGYRRNAIERGCGNYQPYLAHRPSFLKEVKGGIAA